MLNKKMLLSVLIIGCIATVASAGTFAYFSDAASTSGNTVQSGTLKLNHDALASATLSTLLAQPGDNQKNVGTGSISVQNAGSLDGKVTATISGASGTGMWEHMIIYINGVEAYNRGNYYPVDLGTVNAGTTITPTIQYTFADKDTADQNDAQGQTFTFNVNFALNQL